MTTSRHDRRLIFSHLTLTVEEEFKEVVDDRDAQGEVVQHRLAEVQVTDLRECRRRRVAASRARLTA